jgi:c-di-GMP-related signal transduction protein
VRARFCELIAPRLKHNQSELYLMGLLSLMDAILEVPMGVAIEGLPLDPVYEDATPLRNDGQKDTSLTPSTA